MECKVCLDLFNSNNKVPIVLIPCGHTVCNLCTIGLITCPFCRSDIKSLVINWIMLQSSDEATNINQTIETNTTASDFIYYGDYFFKEKKFEMSIYYFTKAYFLDKTIDKPLFKRALAYFNLKNYTDCIRDMEQFLLKNPNDFESYKVMGNCYTYLKDFRQAYDNYSKALLLYPHNTPVLYMKAHCLLILKKFKKALDIYNELLTFYSVTKPLLLEILQDKCVLYYWQGKYKKSLEEIEQILCLRETAADYYMKAVILNSLPNTYKNVIQFLDKAIECDHNYIKAYKLKENLIYKKDSFFDK